MGETSMGDTRYLYDWWHGMTNIPVGTPGDCCDWSWKDGQWVRSPRPRAKAPSVDENAKIAADKAAWKQALADNTAMLEARAEARKQDDEYRRDDIRAARMLLLRAKYSVDAALRLLERHV